MMTRCANGHRPYDTDLWPSGCPTCIPLDPRPSSNLPPTRVESSSEISRPGLGGETTVMVGKGSKRLMGWLVVQQGSQKHKDFRLVEGENCIGRATNIPVSLQDTNVSNEHASVICDESGYEIIDRRSRNGTFLNDNPKPVVRESLEHGDVIHVGDTALKFIRYE